MPKSMPAISLWQPWASLIAEGVKQTETRSWTPPRKIYGQRVAIHAAKRWTKEEVMAFRDLWPWSNEEINVEPLGKDLLPLGKVVATCIIETCYRSDNLDDQLARTICNHNHIKAIIDSSRYGDYSDGRFIWILKDIEKVEPPFSARGAQGFFTIYPPASHNLRYQHLSG